MHKLISKGFKHFSFSFPKAHHIFGIKFSSQIDVESGDQTVVSRSLYSDEEFRKIEEIQQMSYQNLLEEVKKFSNKPKSKTKQILIQFLIEQVPKKGKNERNINFSQEFEVEEEQTAPNKTNYQLIHNEESYSTDTEQAITMLQENSFFNDLKLQGGLLNPTLTFPENQKFLPYIENYPEKQLIDHIGSLSNIDFKREMEQLIHRSPLYSKSLSKTNIKKLAKEDLSSSFKDMIFVHREYAHLHRNILKHILTDPKGKLYNTLDCLEALRSLEKSTNLSRWHSYILTLSPNSMIKFWNVIFESIDSKPYIIILSNYF